MSKKYYIGYYFGIGHIEEIVRKRRDKFIKIIVYQTIASVICHIIYLFAQSTHDKRNIAVI